MRAENYISDHLVELCKKRDISKYQLAQITGMSQSSIGKIISKESLPTVPTLEKICDALGMTLAQFFSGAEAHSDLTEAQSELLDIWDNLDAKEQKVLMAMARGLRK